MKASGGSRGFLGGAALGLALALLLVGAGSLFYRQAPRPASSESTGAVPNLGAAASSSVASTQAKTAPASQAQAGVTVPPESSTQASGNASEGSGGIVSGLTFSVAPAPRPSSALSMLPAEGVGALVGTLAPLLVGLVVAAMVYGAYSRRQDSSS